MKWLIIPDVHNHYEGAERLIRMFPEHKVVFLGDYFDDYGDGPTRAKATAEWLRWSVHQDNRIHLLGNHDLPYRWQDQQCPGHTREKRIAVNSVMKPADWNETRLALSLQLKPQGFSPPRPIVMSHAGFTLANLYGVGANVDVARGGRCAHLRDRRPGEHLAEIRKQWLNCLQSLNDRTGEHFWLNQGPRTGHRNIAGPFWLDKDDMRSPLPGIDQIVGHSRVRVPSVHCVPCRAKPDCEVWFIDNAGHYAVTLDGSSNGRGGQLITPIHARGEQIGEPWVA